MKVVPTRPDIYIRVCKAVEMSKLTMTEQQIIDQYNEYVDSKYSIPDMIEAFNDLIQDQATP